MNAETSPLPSPNANYPPAMNYGTGGHPNGFAPHPHQHATMNNRDGGAGRANSSVPLRENYPPPVVGPVAPGYPAPPPVHRNLQMMKPGQNHPHPQNAMPVPGQNGAQPNHHTMSMSPHVANHHPNSGGVPASHSQPGHGHHLQTQSGNHHPLPGSFHPPGTFISAVDF